MRSSLVLTLILCAAASALGQPYRYEAEDGTMFGTVVANSVSGYSGDGYVTGFDSQSNSDYFEIYADVPHGLYELWVGYRSPFGEKGYTYRVDGQIGSGMFDQTFASDWWQEDRAGLFNVTGGTNTLGIRENWGYYDIDYLEFRPFAPPAITPVAVQLSDPQADRNTRLLMNYMASLYGHKTLSGHQHDESKNLAFPSSTFTNLSGGLHPAIRSSDLMEYSPTRIQNGSNPRNESEQSIAWAQQTGGIVSLTWHWNAPDDLVDAGDWPWWRGFYTDGTTFNLPAALADPESDDYEAIIRDIDAIADELQKFEDDGVPVVWRPLHEAQGGWFWWGAHGPDTFKDLWHLMHDRMTNVHGLHNLIWEFTSSAALGNHLDWYPGDDVVDLVGLDVYTDPTSSMSGEWYDTLEHYDGRKMIALSESGTLPNADLMETYGIAWSYYSLWKDGFLDDFTPAEVQALMGDDDVITLDELMTMPWSDSAPALPGDYNGDNSVDAADYTVWRDAMTAGSTSLANDLTPGEVDEFDFEVWRTFFGQTLGGGPGAGAAAVPEPASWLLFLLGIAALQRWATIRFLFLAPE